MSTIKHIAKMWAFRSSNGSTMYQTLLFMDGTTSCDCPGWTRRNVGGVRTCKHTRMVEVGIADTHAEAMKEYGDFNAKFPVYAAMTKQPKRKESAPEGNAPVRAITFED